MSDRNEEIIEAIRQGGTLQGVGTAFGVTRERVRQIVKKAGVVPSRSPRTMHPCARPGCSVRTKNEQCWRHTHSPLRTEPLLSEIHGTVACYQHGRCRCAECRQANTTRLRGVKADMARRVATDAPHGTSSGYTNWGCRCEPCSQAHRIQQRAAKDRLTARGRESPHLIPHGTISGYALWSCRCAECIARANRDKGRTA